MSYNWSIITDKLYGIVKGSCDDLVMYDSRGNETINPKDATRFLATITSADPSLDNFTILVAIHDQGQTSYINIKTPELKNDNDFKTVHRIRNHIRKAVGQREGLKVVWQVFDHAIDPREEAVHNIKESKDVSKWFGTTKSSFQRIGEAKLIIRHTDTVNEEKHGARTRHIKALFVENKLGERFAYPHLHMAGARAFARHISNGGTNHDQIAESIFNLSKDYLSLRHAGSELRQRSESTGWVQAIRESMNGINRRLKSLHGPKGYANAAQNLTTESIVIDEHAIGNLHAKLAETCSCGKEDQGYDDFGTAAKYLNAMGPLPDPTQIQGNMDREIPQQTMSQPLSFSWTRKPNLSAAPQDNVLERLHWQISELADACTDQLASGRLSEIADMIASGMSPSEDDLDVVREAVSSGMSWIPENNMIPEEIELDEFFSAYMPETIFSEKVEQVDGDHKTDHTTSNPVKDVESFEMKNDEVGNVDESDDVFSNPMEESSDTDIFRMKTLAGI